MRKIKKILVLGLIFCLTACTSWWNKDDDHNPFEGQSAKQLYTDAKKELANKQYTSAIKRFEALETMYPFNDYAELAEVDLIYAYYKKGEYPSAAATSDQFIHLYPRSTRVEYAYYMKALSNFQQVRGTMANLFAIDESWRDPGSQSQAYSDFATLVQKFPDGRYRANALQRMIYLRNMFAKRELNVSNYYYERQMYVAAAERANYLMTTYPQAPSVKPALAIVYRANLMMGLNKAAEDALKVYQATYHTKP